MKQKKNFWRNLPRPFFVLAPMDDVTDTAFRQLVASCGAPDVFFTEFANSDGYCSAGRAAVMKKLKFSSFEQPLIAQIWGLKPENYQLMAKDLVKMGFAGIDINMGCPERKVLKNGACSGLIKNPKLAAEIIQATKAGAGNLPVSVKTRIGIDRIVTDEWVSFLLEQGIEALTIHARTAKELSEVPVHPDQWRKAVELRNRLSPSTVVIANGDILSRLQGEEIVQEYGVDGIMIGRGIFQNLFIFADQTPPLSVKQRLDLLRWHVELYQANWGTNRNFQALKRFFKIYVRDFESATALRSELMECRGYEEVYQRLQQFLKQPASRIIGS